MTRIAVLLAEGTSDRVLIPILEWLLGQLSTQPWVVRWAQVPPSELASKVRFALQEEPCCSLLFVHRDSDGPDPEPRYLEIAKAVGQCAPHVAVVPIRAQEAWLLHDEAALRRAAGRPSGRIPLDLPTMGQVEGVAQPKQVLHEALKTASETSGRRAQRFSPHKAAHFLAMLVGDWSPLRQLSGFRRLESDTHAALRAIEG